MRRVNVIKGDIVFQWKYGFYALYFLMCIIYFVIFSLFKGDMKDTVISICVYSDPAAMGMFFMGALILLEKSQRVTNSIAISPVTVEEYILGKIMSIGIISEIVGIILFILISLVVFSYSLYIFTYNIIDIFVIIFIDFCHNHHLI